MRNRTCVAVLLVLFLPCPFADARDSADQFLFGFESGSDLSGLDRSGAVSIDSKNKHTGATSIRLGPSSKVEIPLRTVDGTGSVDMWVYEDGNTPEDAKKHAAGAMWGLKQANGHVLAIGAIYAPYLAGDTTYATAAFNADKQQRPWQEVQYLGIKRKKGWHRWTFDFRQDSGLRILLDGKDLNARREVFNWNKSRLDGFVSVVLSGDQAGSGQSLWVDDMVIKLGPPSEAATIWPPPPPTPPTDLVPHARPVKQGTTRYAEWARGPSQTSDYFPIAVWLQDPKYASRYAKAGINIYIGLWKGPTDQQLDELREAGMQVVCDQNGVAMKRLDDPTIVAWMHGDEPDNAHKFDSYWEKDKEKIEDGWPDIYAAQRLNERDYRGYGPPVPPKWIVRDYEKIKRNDPSRPIVMNLGQGVAWDAYHGRGERTGHLEDYAEYIRGCDIVSFDIYPGAHSDLKVKDALWYVAQGVRRLRDWSGDRQVVWNAIECTTISDPKSKPTPSQVKAEVWMSIIYGSRGIIYFVHQFKPQFNEHALLDDPKMLEMVTSVNRQIHELASVINDPNTVAGIGTNSTNANTPIHIMAKRHDDALYLFAVAMYQEPTTGQFRLPREFDAAKVVVLSEEREIDVKNGEFSDTFQGNEVHLYKIDPKNP